MQGRTETVVGIFVLAALGVFIYMGFEIGAFRFDKGNYNQYVIFFKDISGLSRKADVKIAGVKVGWVEDITLHADGDVQAEAKVMVLKEFSLYSDSYAIVRQQGLLGPNYLEINTGDPLLRKLDGGETLSKPSKSPVSIDELLQQFKKIASNVEDVTEAVQAAIGGEDGKAQMRVLFDNINKTAERMASFSDVLDRTITRNEDNLDDILALGKDLRRLAEKLEEDIFPAFKDTLEHISSAGEAIEGASVGARDGLKSLASVAEKIDEGKGLLGKLINEDETYKDLKIAVGGLKDYFTKTDRMQIVFDSHFESMHRPAEHYIFEDSKGFFDVRIHATQDRFYLLQLAASEKGDINRHIVRKTYLDDNGYPICKDTLKLDDSEKYDQEVDILNRNRVRFGLQFGKIFKDTIALRFGMFEGSAGFAVDVDIPLGTDKFRWVTSLEMYDMTGQNRINDRRPHIKWLNRMFLLQNIYVTFGADDFASRHNSNVFVGGGLRFGDDDVKFLLSSISGGGGGGGGTAFSTGTIVGG
ncbi:MAG: MlaD family protein [Candidatus Dependentiae bacterium]|nr:MlaD family protein [Candidatus Dependentiae bacterium]